MSTIEYRTADMHGRHQLGGRPYGQSVSVLAITRRLTREAPTAHLEHLRTRLIHARNVHGQDVTVEWQMEAGLRDRTTT